MRIFAVSKHLTLGCSNADDRRQAVGLVLDALHGLRRPNPTLVKGSGDGRVVARSLLEGFQRQGLAQVKADGFRRGCGPQGIEHVRVAFWPYHNQDVSVVLRRGPHEGGASDVDHFEEFGFGERWLFCCCLGKGVEVDRHHLNGGIAEFLQVSSVVFSLQTSKERAVNGGVKRLHTPVEDLRMARGLDTSVTVNPASRKVLAVPPVDRSSKPKSARPCAKGTMSRLSHTLSKARGRTGSCCMA